MKAVLSTVTGGPETLVTRDVPDPEPGMGEVRIRIETCGLNFADLLLLEDRYQTTEPRPFIPGSEISGRIDALGEGVSGFGFGQRVAAFAHLGGLAELACIPAAQAVPVPAQIEGAEAAMLLTTYATSFHALVDRGRIVEGDRVLVLGAGGGVGLAAVEIAASLGAQVFAAASSAEKVAAAQAAGAKDGLVYPTRIESGDAMKAFSTELKALVGGGGSDIVYDPVGGSLAEPALRTMAWGGRYLVVGFAAGIPSVRLNLPLLKGCEIVGVLMDAFARRCPDASRRNIDRLFELRGAGRLRPRIGATFPLEHAAEGFELLRRRTAIGKVVIAVG